MPRQKIDNETPAVIVERLKRQRIWGNQVEEPELAQLIRDIQNKRKRPEERFQAEAEELEAKLAEKSSLEKETVQELLRLDQ